MERRASNRRLKTNRKRRHRFFSKFVHPEDYGRTKSSFILFRFAFGTDPAGETPGPQRLHVESHGQPHFLPDHPGILPGDLDILRGGFMSGVAELHCVIVQSQERRE